MDPKKQRVQIIQAVNGQDSAVVWRNDGRELSLHSRFDPGEEARFLIAAIPVREKVLYVIFGAGLGYHIKELLIRIPQSCRIVVVEAAGKALGSSILAYYRAKNERWVEDRRLTFTTFYDPATVCFTLTDIFTRNRLHSLEVFTHIPSAITEETFYRQAAKIVPRDFAVHLRSRLGEGDKMLEYHLTNYWANLQPSWQAPSIAGFAGRWAGKPAIVVAAGPSLSSQLEALRQMQGRALIICVGTAAKILLANEICPDFVITVDPYAENEAHFAGWNTAKSALIYYQQVWRGIPANYQGPRFWFTMEDEPLIPLMPALRINHFNCGGTVAFAALQFAHYVKADPIIFSGLDFAFRGGRTHAVGAVHSQDFSEDILPEGFFLVPGTNGDMVVTNYTYYAYLLYLQEYIQKYPDIRYINTAMAGAKIMGMETLPLEEVVKSSSACEIATSEIIRNVWQTFQPPARKAALALLDRWHTELSRFLQSAATAADEAKVVDRFRKLEIYQLNRVGYDAFLNRAYVKDKFFGEGTNISKKLIAHGEYVLPVILKCKEALIR